MEKHSPFEELSEIEQRACIDVAAAVAILETRMSLGKDFYDALIARFALSRSMPANTARYALKHVGTALFSEDWIFTISKSGVAITTQFQRSEPGANGQSGEFDPKSP